MFVTRFLYSIVFEDKSVYVGITINPEVRFYNHKNGSCNKLVAKKINKISHSFHIHGRIKALEQLSWEHELIKWFICKGYSPMNISYTGGMGRKPNHNPVIINESEVMIKYPPYI